MKNVRINLNNLKIKLEKLDVDKLETVPVDLSNLSDVVKNDVVRKDAYYTKILNIKNKILDITNLATNTTLNVKINAAQGKISSIANIATILLLMLK